MSIGAEQGASGGWVLLDGCLDRLTVLDMLRRLAGRGGTRSAGSNQRDTPRRSLLTRRSLLRQGALSVALVALVIPVADGALNGGLDDAATGSAHQNMNHGSDSGRWVPVGEERAVYRAAEVPTRHQVYDFLRDPLPGWGTSRIGFLAKCESVGHRQVDAIVAPGAQQSAHLHEFFGNRVAVTPTLTTQMLFDSPNSDVKCSDLNDRSAYWSPAVYQNGKLVSASAFSAYYKSIVPVDQSIPVGLRMIAGDAEARANQPQQVGGWVVSHTNSAVNTYGGSEMVGRTRNSQTVNLRVNFPNCWDGKHLDSPDHQSHMAYSTSRGCPASHPVRIPQLVTFTFYDIAGGDGLKLASGEWYTFHQDFWNGWSPDHMDELTELCIQGQANCRVNSTPALQRLGQRAVTVGGDGSVTGNSGASNSGGSSSDESTGGESGSTGGSTAGGSGQSPSPAGADGGDVPTQPVSNSGLEVATPMSSRRNP